MSEFKYLKDKEHYGDIYQDIRVGGEVVIEGWRECQSRWDIIQPHIPDDAVILDIGSNAGYFGQRIVDHTKNTVVWSMESDAKRRELQIDMLLENNSNRVAVTASPFSLHSALKLKNTVCRADAILAFSILEYFPPDDLMEIIRMFSQIAPMLLIEMPFPEEKKAASHSDTIVKFHPFEKYLKLFFEYVGVIGAVPSATDPNIKRNIYLCKNPAIYNERLRGYFHDYRAVHILATDRGRWILNGHMDITSEPAICLWNLLYNNLCHPAPDFLIESVLSAYEIAVEEFLTPTDVHPRNCLFTPNGIRVIDYLELYGRSLVYGRPRSGMDGFNLFHSKYLQMHILDITTAIRDGNLDNFKLGYELYR